MDEMYRKGKMIVGITALVYVLLNVWLTAVTHVYFALVFNIIIAIFIYKGSTIARIIFVITQATRLINNVYQLFNADLGILTDAQIFYIYYIIFSIASIIFICFEKNVKEYFKSC